MHWSIERKREACLSGPLSAELLGADTQVIERPGWYQIVTPGSSGHGNEVALSELDTADVERVIDEVVASYRALGVPTKWYVGYWTKPADFGERLARRGFESWGMRGMGCATSLELPVPAHISVGQISEVDLEEYVAVTMRGWGNPPEDRPRWRALFLKGMRAEPRTVFNFGARLAGELVGTASLALRDDYGYLMGAQVLEAARGSGAYRALVAARLTLLRELGIEYAVIQAQEATSAPILEHLGFETLFHSKCYRLNP